MVFPRTLSFYGMRWRGFIYILCCHHPGSYVAMAGFRSHVHQLRVYDHRDPSNPTKLSIKRNEKPITLHVSLYSDPVIGHGLCFLHDRYDPKLHINRRNRNHVVYPHISENDLLKTIIKRGGL